MSLSVSNEALRAKRLYASRVEADSVDVLIWMNGTLLMLTRTGASHMLSLQSTIYIQQDKLNDSICLIKNLSIMGQCCTEQQKSTIDMLHISKSSIKDENMPLSKRKPSKNNIINIVNEPSCKALNHHMVEKSANYGYLSTQLVNILQGSTIEKVLIDRFEGSRITYIVNLKSYTCCMLMRQFQQQDSQEYINLALELRQIDCSYLHKMTKTYTIIPTSKSIKYRSQIIELQHVDITLSTIIDQRRKHQHAWTLGQFAQLMQHSLQALSALHRAKITHNDVNTSNIFYSKLNNKYFLGGFTQSEQTNYSDFLDDDISTRIQLAFKKDVLELGMTFLAAFYLVEPIDRSKVAVLNRSYEEQYPFLLIIRMMIADKNMRISADQAKIQLLRIKKHLKLDTVSGYNCLSAQHKPYSPLRHALCVIEGYKRLGHIQKWQESLQNRSNTVEQLKDLQTADYLRQMGSITSLKGDESKALQFYYRSAQINKHLGAVKFHKRLYPQAIFHFQRGLIIIEQTSQKQHNPIYLQLLMSLKEVQIVSGFALVDSEQLCKFQQMIQPLKSQHQGVFWELQQQLINIHTYYQNYQQVRRLLKYILQNSDLLDKRCQIRMLIVQNQIQHLKHSKQQEKQRLLRQIERDITYIQTDFQQKIIKQPILLIKIDILKATLVSYTSQNQLAIERYKNIVYKLSLLAQQRNQVRLTIQHNQLCLLKAKAITMLADAFSSSGQFDSSLQEYDKAIQLYQNIFGNIYNIQTAQALLKIANMSFRMDDRIKQKESRQLGTKILRAILGPFHKNILILQHQVYQ